MNNTICITFVEADDWQAMYIDGKLVLEDPCLYLFDVLEHIKGRPHTFCRLTADYESHPDGFPTNLEDVHLEDEE